MSATKQNPEQIVLDFIGAFRESWPKDLDVALAPLAEDAYYQLAVPSFAPVKGRAAIKAELELLQPSRMPHGATSRPILFEAVHDRGTAQRLRTVWCTDPSNV